MAYHKIPKRFNIQEIAAELKTRLLYADDSDPGAIDRIADIIGSSKRTVYAILDGEIKLPIDFLHAAVIATNGHPEVARFLEPDGFCLVKSSSECMPDKSTLAEECLDDVQSLARYYKVLSDPASKSHEVDIALNEAIFELQQNRNKWRMDRKLAF